MGVKPISAPTTVVKTGDTIVSVPLRGNGCETDSSIGFITKTIDGVSVPLRGNGCETVLSVGEGIQNVQACFRPLAG